MDVDVTIVGGGVVGVACAAALAAPSRSVLLIERNARLGLETSSRNSGVIHAGIYYAEGSLKARLCVEGRERLYRHCVERGVPHRRIGKLIVATDPREEEALESIRRRAEANGVSSLVPLDAPQLRALEPEVRATAALHSPETGIVDALALVASLWREAQDGGAELVLGTEVGALDRVRDGWRVTTATRGGGRSEHTSRLVVNAAGLASDTIAARAGIDVDAAGYRIHAIKGDYVSVAPAAARRVSRLVYPVPPAAGHGLGVHWTLDLEGRARLGPDATWIDRDAPSYAVDATKCARFLEGARRFLPFLALEQLAPESSGIRPSRRAPGAPEQDFVVAHESARGLPGLVNLIGIESPGLTSCLAIAAHVRALLASADLLD
ncbi:MAG: NAD(P)/FAD-dependent oxidoreductase [bacterium]